MATLPRVVDPTDTHTDPAPASAPAADKPKRTRSPSVAKPAFFIVQVTDESGQPMQFDKRRLKIISVERDAEKVMELVESGSHPHAFYLRGIVPVTKQTRTPPATA